MPSLTDYIRAEINAVTAGTRPACGWSCACHGHTCGRATHDDTPARRIPHYALLEDDSLIQWTGPCTNPPHE